MCIRAYELVFIYKIALKIEDTSFSVCFLKICLVPEIYRMNVAELERNIDVVVALLKALSNEKRLQILCALYKAEKSVGELEKLIGISQSSLSQHLARLRRDGLVQTRRNAQSIHYSLSDGATEAVLKTLYELYCPEKNPS